MSLIKIILNNLIFLPFILGATYSSAQNDQTSSENKPLEQIITPDLERREISEAILDSENWEIGVYGGILSIEDFGSNSVAGLRFAYHLTEDFVIEFNYGASEASDETFRSVVGGILEVLNNTDYAYYNISLVYNLFQGEVFFGKNTAFNNGFYLLAGGGNTTFNDNDYFTVSFGGGMRFYANDWTALHFTVKDHIFDNDITNKTTNNLEATLGLSFYF